MANGKTKVWSIYVGEEDGVVYIRTEYGFEDGKKQIQQKNVTEGKNIGKKNETTPLDQAIKDALKAWTTKCENGYAPRSEEMMECSDEKHPLVSDDVCDRYTQDILCEQFQIHKEYVVKRKLLKLTSGMEIRMPNMPEDISENIVKFIIHNHLGDTTSKWTKGINDKKKKLPGDLISQKEGTQEVKCFTSDGPPSFGPRENWDVIYFLDARAWIEERFVLWRVPLSNTSTEWKNIKMNKQETHEEQSSQGRRPRITWEGLRPQLGDHLEKIFDGTFNEIFLPREVESDDPQ
jgi:hypothetical protein